MKGRSNGRTVVVTGASAGVGRATAIEFGSRGDTVALLARGQKGLESAAHDVELAGGRALPIVVDVADHAQVDAAAARVEKEVGPIDVWVNNAFSSVFAPFMEQSMEEFHRTTEVTYLGFVHGTRAALERMLPRNKGAIVQVGSALAYRGIPLQSGYCGAKHAIQGFTESVRCELLHDGVDVHVTMVQLPAVNTPQFDWVLSRLPDRPQPVPPIYQPEVVARQIAYAADHPQRREYVVGGSAAATILGNRFVAGVLDRYLAFTGYDSQQTGEPARSDRPANLWRPVDDDRSVGVHGSFDDQARTSSAQSWHTRAGLSPALVNAGAALVSGVRMVAQEPKAFVDAVLARSA
jgi:NAD(P)-dependent dehydrogenase (short-subunit alcohol dehydrogenase family)